MEKKKTHPLVSTSLSAIAVNVLLIAQLVALPHLLPPQEMGLATSALIVVGLLQTYNDFGFSNALLHFQKITKKQLDSLYAIGFGIGLFLLALLLSTSHLIADFFNQPRLGLLLNISGIGLIITSAGQQFSILIQRDLHFGKIAKIEATSSFIGVLASLIIAYLTHDAISVVLSYLTSTSIKSIMAIYAGRAIWTPSFRLEVADMKPIFKYSLFQLGERTINYLFRNLDKFIIAKVLGPQAVAIYNLAYQLATKAVAVITPIFTKITTPLYAKHQDNTELMNKDCLALHQVQAVIFFPLAAGIFVLTKPLVSLILPATWHDTGAILQALAPLCALYALGNPLGSVLVAKGRADIGFYFNLFASLVYAAVMWLTIHKGLIVMAWSISAATLMLLPIDIQIRRKLLFQTLSEYTRATLPAAISSMTSGLITWLVLPHLTTDLLQSVIGALCGLTLYLVFLFAIRPTIYREMTSMWAGRF